LRLCELLEQLLDPAGLRLAGVDDIDINVITVAECSEAFGEICHRRVDRTADEEIRPWRARGTTDDIDDIAMDLLEQRPEQPRKPDGGVEFQRKAVGPQGIRLLEKIATEGRSGTVDQNVATFEVLVDSGEDLLAGFQRAQIAGDRHRLRATSRSDRVSALGEIS